MIRLRNVLLGVLIPCAVVLATPALADLAAWDQTRVTTIARQLADAADAWELAVREQPGGQIGSGDAQQEFGLAARAQALREQARALADHLAAGKGHDETRDEYRSLKETIDYTEEVAQRAQLDEPTMDSWSKVVDAQRQIAPYYDPKALGGEAP